ncbi:HEAT repeat domain-containing protein [Pseudomonas purpurea]|uniref:HEAT repeat domain-containing protein n=1 Tax=Pseudomonas purpurea TaxID=3136737 RepID=UPI00326736A7
MDTLNAWIGDRENSPWNEYHCEHVAKGVLAGFSAAQWEQLRERITSQPQHWQARCAEVLGAERSANAIELLKGLLLASPYLNVRASAACELEWADAPIEAMYAASIQDVLQHLPHDAIEPELPSLLARAESGQ